MNQSYASLNRQCYTIIYDPTFDCKHLRITLYNRTGFKIVHMIYYTPFKNIAFKWIQQNNSLRPGGAYMGQWTGASLI